MSGISFFRGSPVLVNPVDFVRKRDVSENGLPLSLARESLGSETSLGSFPQSRRLGAREGYTSSSQGKRLDTVRLWGSEHHPGFLQAVCGFHKCRNETGP